MGEEVTVRTDLQTAVYTAIGGLGYTTIAKGSPHPDPVLNTPYSVIEIEEPEYERLTFGTAGQIAQRYDVNIWFVLGSPDMTPQQAEEAKIDLADQMRATFANFEVDGLTTIDLVAGSHNIKTYMDEGKPPQAVYVLRVVEIHPASTASGILLLTRIAAAVNTGWRHLGTLPVRAATISDMAGNGTLVTITTQAPQTYVAGERVMLSTPSGSYSSLNYTSQRVNTVVDSTHFTIVSTLTGSYSGSGRVWMAPAFRESDALYNPDDRMYYVFSTSGDGNPVPGGGVDSHISMRRASTLEEVVLAEGANYIPRARERMWYPAVYETGTGTATRWDIWATSGANSISHSNVTGTDPLWVNSAVTTGVTATGGTTLTFASHSFTVGEYLQVLLSDNTNVFWMVVASVTDTTVTFNSPAVPSPLNIPIGRTVYAHQRTVGTRLTTGTTEANCSPISPFWLGDICVRKHPTNGYWYAAGLYNNSDNDIRIYRTTDITSECSWRGVTGSVTPVSVWGTIAQPAWCLNYTPDVNIFFTSDGRMWMTWTGSNDGLSHSTAVVEIDVTTGKAIGTVVMLLEYGAYPAFAGGNVLSDTTYLVDGEGVEHLVAFTNAPFDGLGGGGVWACLDLAA